MKTYQGELASANEVFYYEVGEELVKKRIPFLNDVLRQLLTLSVGLAGGGIFFLSDPVCDKVLKICSVCMFFIAIIFALVGTIPFSRDVNMFRIGDVEKLLEDAASWKRGWLWGASVFLFLGLILAFVGVIIKGL